jgi:hypothetical protein
MSLKAPSPSTLEKTQATLAQLFTWLANGIGPEELQALNANTIETKASHNQGPTNTAPH